MKNKWRKCENRMTKEIMEYIPVTEWSAEGGESIQYHGGDKTLPKRLFKQGFMVRFTYEEDKKHLMYLNAPSFDLSFKI